MSILNDYVLALSAKMDNLDAELKFIREEVSLLKRSSSVPGNELCSGKWFHGKWYKTPDDRVLVYCTDPSVDFGVGKFGYGFIDDNWCDSIHKDPSMVPAGDKEVLVAFRKWFYFFYEGMEIYPINFSKSFSVKDVIDFSYSFEKNMVFCSYSDRNRTYCNIVFDNGFWSKRSPKPKHFKIWGESVESYGVGTLKIGNHVFNKRLFSDMYDSMLVNGFNEVSFDGNKITFEEMLQLKKF